MVISIDASFMIDLDQQPELRSTLRKQGASVKTCPHCGAGSLDLPAALVDRTAKRLIFTLPQMTVSTQPEPCVVLDMLRHVVYEEITDPPRLEVICRTDRALISALDDVDPNDPSASFQHLIEGGIEAPLRQYLYSTDFKETRLLLRAHPELLDPAADAMLAQMMEEQRASGHEARLRLLSFKYDMLSECRIYGVDAVIERGQAISRRIDHLSPESQMLLVAKLQGPEVFKAVASQTPNIQERYRQFAREMEALGPIPDTLEQQVQTAFDALFETAGFEELTHLLQRRSILCSPRMETLLRNVLADYHAKEDHIRSALVQGRLWLIRRTKEVGIQAAVQEFQTLFAQIDPLVQEFTYDAVEGRLPLSILSDREARVRLLTENPALFARVEAVMRVILRGAIERGDAPDPLCDLKDQPEELRELYIDMYIGRLPLVAFEDLPALEATHPAAYYRLEQLVGAMDDPAPEQAASAPSLSSQAWYQAVAEQLGLMWHVTQRVQHFGDPSLLHQAVAAWEQARAHPLFATADPDMQATFISGAGLLYVLRYETYGDPDDLDRSIACYTEMISLSPEGSPSRFEGLMQQAGVLATRYMHQTNNLADLHQAIVIGRAALECIPPDRLAHALARANIARFLVQRFERTGAYGDLQESIDLLEDAVDELSSSEYLPSNQSQLGLNLAARAQITGSAADLERAVDLTRKASLRAESHNPDLPHLLGNWAIALGIRYQLYGTLEDLNEQITLCQQALELMHANDRSRIQTLIMLSDALRDRSRLPGYATDLYAAISYLLEAERDLPHSHPHYHLILFSYGKALAAHYHASGDRSALNHAINLLGRAYSMLPVDAPHRAMIMEVYGHNLLKRNAPEDIAAAIAAAREAAVLSSDNALVRAGALSLLALALRRRPSNMQDIAVVNEIRQAYEAACLAYRNLLLAGAMLDIAREWGDWATQRQAWPEAVRAYEYALTAVDSRYRVQVLRTSQDQWLEEVRGLHAAAAYAHARAGDLRAAALTLERGRTRGLNMAISRDHADLEQLRTDHPDAYERYQTAAARLRGFESAQATSHLESLDRSLPSRNHIERARLAAADLEAAVVSIRAIKGFAEFLMPVSVTDLDSVTLPGCPFVYIAAASAGGLALILSRAAERVSADVDVVWLPQLTEDAVAALVTRGTESWLGVYGAYHRRPTQSEDRFGLVADHEHAPPQREDQRWLDTIDATIRRLWDLVMGPVIERLEARRVTQAMLIPAGLLALLPLHAAWFQDAERRVYALDRLQLSYAPSARILTSVRSRVAGRNDRLVAVEEPQPVHGATLPAAHHEINAIHQHFLDPSVMRGATATRHTVLATLPDGDVAHFACHAGADWNDPHRSGLLLAGNDVLTVDDLLALRLQRARLAVLSACETAMIGTNVPDEAISLPAGFLRAGFCGVAASLWAVADLSTALLMERFYELWRVEGLEPPAALRQAQIWLRDSSKREKLDHYRQFLSPQANDLDSQRYRSKEAFYRILEQCSDEDLNFNHPYWWSAFQYVGA
jgi:CHAT domain-containing protein